MSPRLTIPRPVRIAAGAAFIALVPLFLIAFNARWVINFPPLYSYGFDRYGIVDYTGIERDDLIAAGKRIRDYFNDGSELLTIPTTVRGVRVRNLYNEREILHMRDVKGLVRGVYRVSEISGLLMALIIAVGFAERGRRFAPILARLLAWGGGATLALAGIVGIAAVFGFERLFLAFHLISFSNDLWQLDPRRDYLIAMFPEGFFFDATMLIAISILTQAAALAIVPPVIARMMRRRSESAAAPRAERRRAESAKR